MEEVIHHGKMLRGLLDMHPMDIATFADLLEVRSLSTVYKMFEEENIGKARLCLICTLFNVSPVYFKKPENYFEPLVERAAQIEENRLIAYNYSEGGRVNYTDFVQDYFKVFTEIATKAQKSFYILDYIGSKEGIPLKGNIGNYHNENQEFFRNLENHIKATSKINENFKYVRICQPPLNHKDKLKTFEERVEFLVESLFLETFEHFCYCYEKLEAQFKLYILPNPLRLFSYYIVDEQFSISEYLRFDEKGVALPDLLFVDKDESIAPNPVAKRLIDTHLADFHQLLKSNPLLGNKLIPKDTFYTCTLSCYRKTKKDWDETIENLGKTRSEIKYLLLSITGDILDKNAALNATNPAADKELYRKQEEEQAELAKLVKLEEVLKNLKQKIKKMKSFYEMEEIEEK